MSHLRAFQMGYTECAEWADAPEGNDAELSDEARDTLNHQAEEFYRSHVGDLDQAYEEHGRDYAHLGHDFWLTRNRHGAGFWDRGMGDVGDRLTDAAHGYGSACLYVGDDGFMHIMEG
jgi:hypothetical protein